MNKKIIMLLGSVYIVIFLFILMAGLFKTTGLFILLGLFIFFFAIVISFEIYIRFKLKKIDHYFETNHDFEKLFKMISHLTKLPLSKNESDILRMIFYSAHLFQSDFKEVSVGLLKETKNSFKDKMAFYYYYINRLDYLMLLNDFEGYKRVETEFRKEFVVIPSEIEKELLLRKVTLKAQNKYYESAEINEVIEELEKMASYISAIWVLYLKALIELIDSPSMILEHPNLQKLQEMTDSNSFTTQIAQYLK